jgi:hypothetical protein
MAIPESQLTTWSSQGSVTQSSNTYQIIRNALLAGDSGYADKSLEVFSKVLIATILMFTLSPMSTP